MLNVWENIVLPVESDGKRLKGYVDEIIDTSGMYWKKFRQTESGNCKGFSAKTSHFARRRMTGNLDSKTVRIQLLKVPVKRFHQTHRARLPITRDCPDGRLILQIEDGKLFQTVVWK